jgi:putative ABC transport system permease protein
MSERSHDIAVMRALGASRNAVMAIILVESILLALGGGVIGLLLGHGLVGLASPYVVERTGISLGLFEFDWQELVLIPALVVLASLVGLLPALAAYRTDVAKSLAGSR